MFAGSVYTNKNEDENDSEDADIDTSSSTSSGRNRARSRPCKKSVTRQGKAAENQQRKTQGRAWPHRQMMMSISLQLQ